MRESLFDVLRDEDLNRIQIHYDRRTDRATLYTAREWDDDIPWRDFNRTFTTYSALTPNAVYHNDRESRALFEKHGLSEYLEREIGLMRKGRHMLLEGFYWKKKELTHSRRVAAIDRATGLLALLLLLSGSGDNAGPVAKALHHFIISLGESFA